MAKAGIPIEDFVVGMIFPGMDPYLEDPQMWRGVHAGMIVYTRDYLIPLLQPRYIPAIEERLYVQGADREIIPDIWVKRDRPENRGEGVAVLEGDAPVVVKVQALEIHESYLTILDTHSGQEVVTCIEIISPANKYPGNGRKSYLKKQEEDLASETHLVEIDLLRTGHHVLAVPEWMARGQGKYDYLTCVNRASDARESFDLYPSDLRHRLPKMRLPLANGDPDVVLDIQAVLTKTYATGLYRNRLRYDTPCRPPLAPEDEAWARELINNAKQATQ